MEGAIDGKPVEFSTFVLIVDESFDSCEVSQFVFVLLDVHQKLHVIPDDVVVFLVLFETVLLSIEDVPLYSADETVFVFVLFQTLLFLTNLGEFVHDYSAYYLVHDDFDDE